MSNESKVGAVVIAALAVLAAGIFLLGERSNLFALKNRYSIQFPTVSGLEAGNPVQLNGVTVGRVEDVVLPEQIEERQLTVWISIDRRFGDRVRTDSLARIKTLGLLGDKYIEISSGSEEAPAVPSGGAVPAAPATDVDRLLSSGEDVVDNVSAISYSLRTLLERMERGEGLLGEMLADSEAGQRTKQAVVETFETLRRISAQIEEGRGTLGALIMDDELAARAKRSLAGIESLLASVDEGAGPLAALLHDQEMRTQLESILENSGAASEQIARLSTELQDGNGLLHRLLTDEEYSRRLSSDLEELLGNLKRASGQLAEGDGTLGQLLHDPHLYQAVDDIIVGIDESRILRWLVRNRQKAGIEKRYKEQQNRLEPADESQTPASAHGTE